MAYWPFGPPGGEISLPTVTEHINMLGHEKPKHNTARKSELDNKTRSGAASALECHPLNTCLSG
jgi:hypothetical protein